MIPLIQFFGVFTAILQLQLIFRASLVFSYFTARGAAVPSNISNE